MSGGRTTLGVAIKPAARHVDVDPLTAAVTESDAPERAGAADLAALEIALTLRDHWGDGAEVVVACAVPPEHAHLADPVLRDALARGADRAVRAEATSGAPGAAGTLARTTGVLAAALDGCDVIVCGDYSADGGTGAVPALLAAAGDRAQALGLLSVRPDPDTGGAVLAERRLDRGRRERLRVRAPMVLSVEGAAARPRRAGLPALLRAGDAPIAIVTAPHAAEPEAPSRSVPYRPRARVLPPPEGATPRDRVLHLLGVAEEREPPRRVDAEPPVAAREIIDQLRRWGYLGTGETGHGKT